MFKNPIAAEMPAADVTTRTKTHSTETQEQASNPFTESSTPRQHQAAVPLTPAHAPFVETTPEGPADTELEPAGKGAIEPAVDKKTTRAIAEPKSRREPEFDEITTSARCRDAGRRIPDFEAPRSSAMPDVLQDT